MSKFRSSSILLIALVLAITFIQPTFQKKRCSNGSSSSGNSGSSSGSTGSGSGSRTYCGPLAASGPDVPCTLELNPVCGYKSGSSKGIDAGNPCAACAGDSVEYYYEGECKDQPDRSQEEEPSKEDRLFKCIRTGVNPAAVSCLAIYDPVCAYKLEFGGAETKVTVGNDCTACNVGLYDFYRPGACPGDEEEEQEECEEDSDNLPIVRCEKPDLSATDIACIALYDPVCAYKNSDKDMSNGKTLGNACEACSQSGYDFYIKGECPNNGNEEEEEDNGAQRCVHTGANPAAVSCLAIYDPVCAFFDNDTTNGVTVGNDCTACGVLLYDYYFPGECPGDNEEEEEEEVHYPVDPAVERCVHTGANPAAVSCLAIYDPVCAFFDNDTTNGVTIGNDCTACGVLLYDFYIRGSCPGDEGESGLGEGDANNNEGVENGENGDFFTRCQLPDLSATNIACDMMYEPVCAYRDDEDGSGATMGNACVACYQQGYDYYSKGECANNNEEEEVVEEEEDLSGQPVVIKCEKPDLSATDIACVEIYQPVCAYKDSDKEMKKGKTAGNACEACLQSGYDFYTKGACGDENNL